MNAALPAFGPHGLGDRTIAETHICHHFKRLRIIDTIFGDHAYHLKRYVGL